MPRRLFADEETLLALGVTWTVGMLFFTLGGFYMGNIISVPPPHARDLQVPDMVFSAKCAGIGALLGVVFGVAMTILYPGFTRRDHAADMATFAGHGHGHHDDADIHPHSAS